MDLTRQPSTVVTFDDTDSPADVIDILALARFIAGSQPFAITRSLNRVLPDAPLLPPGVSPRWVAVENWGRAFLAMGDGWTLRVLRQDNDRTASLMVTAVDEGSARRVLQEAVEGAEEPPAPVEDAVAIGFWDGSYASPNRVVRDVTVEPWSAVRRNYTAGCAWALERLMGIRPPAVPGRLLLMHGPPGTGKTTALRALANAWHDWCRLEVVLDPETLLGRPAYLMEVALHRGEGDPHWRLVVLEDCDDLIRDGGGAPPATLSRLLNITDGLAGQGLGVLVAITTNEPLWRLHPALVRPGRCLAEIYVGPLSRGEAVEWLGSSDGIGPDGATLAQLLALRGELGKLEEPRVAPAVGQYL